MSWKASFLGSDIVLSLSKDLRKRYKAGFVLRGRLRYFYFFETYYDFERKEDIHMKGEKI